MTNESIQTLIDTNNLTLSCVFVPFNQSRNKDENNLSLNWKVTLLMNGKEVLTTDHVQGIGHAPSYKISDKYMAMKAQSFEAGKNTGSIIPQPDIKDVLYCLVMDSDILDYPEFEEWASDCGYEPDSRKIALKLRGALGEPLLTQLREAFQDYYK